MTRILKYISLILLVLSFGFWQNNAQAQCQYLQPNGVTIDPDAVLLEIVGGNLFGGPVPGSEIPRTTHDSFVYLTDDDPNNLHVALIDQATLNAQFSSFPVDSFAFGFSDRIVNTATNGMGFCFINDADGDGGIPTFAYTMDGLNYDTVVIAPGDTYNSCALIKNDNEFFTDFLKVMANNTDTSALDFWSSNDGGTTWGAEPITVTGVLGPPQGVVPNFVSNGNGGQRVFVTRGVGAFPTTPFRNEIFDPSTGEFVVVNTDTIDNRPNDTCAAERDALNIIWFVDKEDATQRAIQLFDAPLGGLTFEDVVSVPVGDPDAPFFGGGCIHVPPGQGNPQDVNFGLTAPGVGTFSVSGRGTNIRVRQSAPNRDPVFNIDQGPQALTKINGLQTGLFNNTLDVGETGWALGQSGTFEYAQCVFGPSEIPIPTLSEWGLIALAGVLMLSGAFYLRRKKAVS